MAEDFVVVGGGPVGLAVAIEATRRGRSAIVVERCRGPVDKACGEGLMPPGVARLRALGVSLPLGRTFRGVRYIDGAVVAEADFARGTGLGVRRLALSDALRTEALRAGVRIVEGSEVRRVAQSDTGVRVETDDHAIEGAWLVAADGLHSAVRRLAHIPATPADPPGGRRFAVRQHFGVAPWSDHVEVYWSDGLEAYVTPVGADEIGVAYLWSGERGDTAAFAARFPTLADRLVRPTSERRGAGPLGLDVERRVAGRVLLAGDAAGYVDAITGEGLSIGWASAIALVDAVVAGRPDRYEQDWQRITAMHRRTTSWLLGVARRPWLRRALVRSLRDVPGLFGAALDRLG